VKIRLLKQPVLDSSAAALQANPFSYSGYRFTGWNTEADGTGTPYAADETATITENLDLYAMWEKKPALPQGGSGSEGSATADHLIISPTENQTIQATVGEKVTLTVNAAPDATGFQWFIDRNDGKGFVTLQGATDSSYTTSALSAGNNGYRYYCAVSNGSAGQLSPFFTLKVGNAAALPSTGDSSLPMLWAATAMLAAVGMAFTMKRGKRV